jgi:hypothetical protein
VPVLFDTGGALGIRPSELSPLGRFLPRFRDEWTHIPFRPSVIPTPERRAGPTGRGFWALTLPGVPGDRRRISVATAGCSLGLYPLRALRPKPDPGFRPDSSHALRVTNLAVRHAGASEYRSAPAWPHHSGSASRVHGWNDPYRVPTPENSRTCERRITRAMSSPHTAPAITDRAPAILG